MDHEVVIVGAGPAGCSAATFLAKRGYEVLLLDKAHFPRDKVCADGIGPLALDVLGRMGVENQIKIGQPWRIDGLEVLAPNGGSVRALFGQVKGLRDDGCVWPRRDFDLMLHEHVRGLPSVRILYGYEAMELLWADAAVCGVTVQGKGHVRKLTAGVIIGSDGAHSTIRRKLFPTSRRPKRQAMAMRGYFDDVQGLDHFIEIHCQKSVLPGYGWIFPVGKRKANVGLGISYRPQEAKRIRGLFQAFIDGYRSKGGRFSEARLIDGSLKGWPIPLGSFRRRRGYRNVLLLGDAGRLADPLTGEGIYHALRSGELAARAVHQALCIHQDNERAGGLYGALCRREFKQREYLLGSLIQRYFLKSAFLNFNVGRAANNPHMATDLAAILCHKKSKLRLLL